MINQLKNIPKEVKIALISTGVIAVIYYLYKRSENKKTIKTEPLVQNPNSTITLIPPPVQSPPQQQTPHNPPCIYPISKGIYNCDKVKSLQFALNRIPRTTKPGFIGCENKCNLKPLVEDGDFGDKTQQLLEDTFGANYFPEWKGISEADLQKIYSYVILDPTQYQAAENPYIIAPNPNTPPPPQTTIDWSTGVPIIRTN